MIAKENYEETHIRELQAMSKGDPGLIERTLFAFGLLEALASVGLQFTFKGGTSLLLLLPAPKRLSTDIDIVVDPGTDVYRYIEKASSIFPFMDMEEQTREGKNNIVKKHFKFTYHSPMKGAPLYILLDILFEEIHYHRVVEKEIKNDLLLTEGENLRVKIPSIDCILGDKLTAFAPYTTGIPLRSHKDMEVIKQYYDINTLIDASTNFEDVRNTYFSVSDTEIRYRGGNYTPEQALEDTIQAAICIGSRGKTASDDFSSYVQGSRDIINHIYEHDFNMEKAGLMAPKIIYMAACLLTGRPFEQQAYSDDLRKEPLSQNDLKSMHFFKKQRNNGYAYLVHADQLLSKYRQ